MICHLGYIAKTIRFSWSILDVFHQEEKKNAWIVREKLSLRTLRSVPGPENARMLPWTETSCCISSE
jgi:hypothetical protein